MKWLVFIAALGWSSAWAQVETVQVHQDTKGYKLQVDGKDFLIRGMNWGYVPVGTNYSYDLWSKPEPFIEEVLHREMKLLQAMGVNAIRLFNTVPPKWITWMRDNYGIYTAVNHLMGRYGFDVNGAFVPNIDYANPEHRAAILADVRANAERFKDVRGVLLYMLGNENNYGLHWTSYEIEALPGEENSAKAVYLYTLLGEAASIIKSIDQRRPISLTNGDLQYIDLIAKHCDKVDIMGTNVYRGPSMRDLYQRTQDTLKKPVLFSEFGADAYNAKNDQEDHLMQADMLLAQWEEIYRQSYGHGGVGNALGGFVFQWSDGWWKYLQHTNLDVHDTNASWPNGGYPDFVEGENNMNEEWFGITAKTRPDDEGHYEVHPRSAYYVLQDVWRLDPYAASTTNEVMTQHFEGVDSQRLGMPYDLRAAQLAAKENQRVFVSDLRMVFSSTVSSGSGATEHNGPAVFDHTESFYPEVSMRPTSKLSGRLTLNILGNVAQNRLDKTFYENRGGNHTMQDVDGEEVTLSSRDRVRVYEAEFSVKARLANIDGFYRVGHYHWGDEGDLFGLYREAYYGPNLDTYDGVAPVGALVTGKGPFDGLKVAFGPEIYWGANPMVIGKYRKGFGRTTLTVLHQEDIAKKAEVQSTFAIPEPKTRKSTLNLEFPFLGGQAAIGGIFAGSEKVGRPFRWQREIEGRGYMDQGVELIESEVQWADTLGAKARFNWNVGTAIIHLQGGYYGLVADGGPNNFPTGWRLHQSGRGNHYGGELGVDLGVTQSFRIEPKVLYQKPLIGPNEPMADHLSGSTGIYYPGVRARNILDDPFAVRDNRETIAGELLLVFDPTPENWFWNWNRAETENAPFAGALSFIYRHHPTTQDAHVAVFDSGLAAFGAAPPARDSWDVSLQWVANPKGLVRLFGNAYVGHEDAMGDSTRQVFRYGLSNEAWIDRWAFASSVKIDDWGPYDFHRDFNLTYPLQIRGDLSWGPRRLTIEDRGTRFGVKGQYRRLDEYSEGYLTMTEYQDAIEMELMTYMEIAL